MSGVFSAQQKQTECGLIRTKCFSCMHEEDLSSNLQKSHKKLSMAAQAWIFSKMGDKKGRISGVCWLSALLQVKGEFQRDMVDGDKSGLCIFSASRCEGNTHTHIHHINSLPHTCTTCTYMHNTQTCTHRNILINEATQFWRCSFF